MRKKRKEEVGEGNKEGIRVWRERFRESVMGLVKEGCSESELREKVLGEYLEYAEVAELGGEEMVEAVMKIAPRREDVKEKEMGGPASLITFAEGIIRGEGGGMVSGEEMRERGEAAGIGAKEAKAYDGGEARYAAGGMYDALEEGKKSGFGEVKRLETEGRGVAYDVEGIRRAKREKEAKAKAEAARSVETRGEMSRKGLAFMKELEGIMGGKSWE